MSAYNQGGMCELCQQKPKAGSHDFCSKICAAQAATLCDYCRQRPKFGGFDYCGRRCRDAANSGANGGGSSTTGAGYGAWVMQTIAQVKNIAGAGSTPPPPVRGPPHASSFSPMTPTPWQAHQKQRGPKPNMKPPTNVTVNIFPPAAGHRGRGKPTNQLPRMIRHSPAETGTFPQYPKAPSSPTSPFAAGGDEYPDEIDEGTMYDFPTEHGRQAHIPLCIMCNCAPQRDMDHFCGDACQVNSMAK